MAAVVRAWMSLPLIISILSVIPRSLAQAGTICSRRTLSEVGTKSFQRSQCTVAPARRLAPVPLQGSRQYRRPLQRLRPHPKAEAVCGDASEPLLGSSLYDLTLSFLLDRK